VTTYWSVRLSDLSKSSKKMHESRTWRAVRFLSDSRAALLYGPAAQKAKRSLCHFQRLLAQNKQFATQTTL